MTKTKVYSPWPEGDGPEDWPRTFVSLLDYMMLETECQKLRAAVSKCTGELGCEAYKLARGADEPGDGAVVMRPYPYTICNAKSPLECERQPDGHCAKCSPESETSSHE